MIGGTRRTERNRTDADGLVRLTERPPDNLSRASVARAPRVASSKMTPSAEAGWELDAS